MQLTPVEFTGRALTIFENVLRARLLALDKVVSKTQVPDVKALLSLMPFGNSSVHDVRPL